jgi:hypothetical protein
VRGEQGSRDSNPDSRFWRPRAWPLAHSPRPTERYPLKPWPRSVRSRTYVRIPKVTRPVEQTMLVEDLAAAGYTHAEIARRSGVPIGTVENWLRGRLSRRARRARLGETSCRRCGADEHQFAQLPTDTYAYLLGVYPGDGIIVKQRRCYSLRVCLDSIYPGIIGEAARAIELLKGVPPWVGPPSHGPMRPDRLLLEELAVSLPSAWAGSKARALDRTSGMAAADCLGSAWLVPTRVDSHRRLAWAQPSSRKGS